MCKYCENEIFRDCDGEFYLRIETAHWDRYDDCYEAVELSGIKYCPYCGEELREDENEDE